VASSTQLVDEVCAQLVRTCGFGRAVLSRVDGQSWRPWVAHFSGAAADAAWFAEWVDRSIPLDDRLLETRLVGERQPAAVYDTRYAPVYRPIIVDAGRSSSYVVAPVVLGDEVVGLVHADHSPSARRVDMVDRDVLWTLTQGFGLAYERLVLVEQVRAQRDRLHEALAAAEAIVDMPDTYLDLALPGPGTVPLPRVHDVVNLVQTADTSRGARPALLEELTGRETQVLELLALGATNAHIADQLVVSESTVKSHVRHILRKVGAVNRAQAISRFLGIASLGSEPADMRQPALR
jgi:DNA-binding CsgD family transcriptional regulator